MNFDTSDQLSVPNRMGLDTHARPTENELLLEICIEQMRKWSKVIAVAICLVLAGFACVLPMYFSGSGWISKASIQNHVFSFAMPGMHFGSQTVYAEKGQSINVEIDIHDVNCGGMYAKIVPKRWGVSPKEFSSVITGDAGTSTLNRVAEASGWYRIEFDPWGETLKTDLRYSATWEVE